MTDRCAEAPAPWVERFARRARPESPVLDVACGGGRDGRLFLARGHPVTFVDRDVTGVADLAGGVGVELVTADLEDGRPWPFVGRTFGAVIAVNYLHRPLLGVMIDALAPGGVLIYETFAVGNERFGRPRNPDFLLAPGELLAVTRGRLETIAYAHGIEVGETGPRVKQRLCAVRRG